MSGGGEPGAGTPAEFYTKGNECFVNDDYAKACELYTSALQLDPLMADALVARAHALIKTDKFEDAKKDADKAIDILRSSGTSGEPSPLASKAFLRSGVASFHLGRYREARNCFVEGQKVGEEGGIRQWLCWCDEKIAKFGDTAPGVKAKPAEAAAAGGGGEKRNKTDDAKTDQPAAPAAQPGAEAAPEVDNNAMPVPKISHDWYQTETQVVVEVRIKKLSADMVKVDMAETSLSVSAQLPGSGSEYR